MRHISSRLVAALTVAVSLATPTTAQTTLPKPSDAEMRTPASGEWASLAINSVLGGVTSGIVRALHGDDVRDAFVRGAAGGAVAYAGKRVAVERWAGAGLLGRQIHGVGASEIANAAAGRGVLQEVAFAAGPVHLYVDRSAGWAVRPRLDVVSAGALAYALTRPGWRMDVGRSLSAGAAVFHNADETHSPEGFHTGGVVRVQASTDSWMRRAEQVVTLEAHERVHVLQRDMSLLLVGRPAQKAVFRHSPAGRALDRWLDVGLQDAAWLAANHALPYRDRPWERESYFLADRPGDSGGTGSGPVLQ